MVTTPLSTEQLLRLAQTLPAAPRILARLQALLLDFTSGLDQIAELLRCDAALVARMVREANSPANPGDGSVTSIEEAVQRVGYSEVYRLAGLAAVAQLGENTVRCYGYSAKLFRENALFVALAAEAVARRADVDFRAAYTVGLLRSVGKLLLDRSGRDHLGDHQTFSNEFEYQVTQWEERQFGVTSPHAAGLVLAAWGFGAPVVQAVEGQYEMTPYAEAEPLAHVLHVACHIAQTSGFGLTGEGSAWTDVSAKLARLRLDKDALKASEEETRAMFATLRDACC